MSPDIRDKLQQIQDRRLVAALCRRCGKPRAWFYKVLAGRASLLPYLFQVDLTLAVSSHPLVAAREALGLSQSALAERIGVSRQTVHLWEREPPRRERLDRVLALRSDGEKI